MVRYWKHRSIHYNHEGNVLSDYQNNINGIIKMLKISGLHLGLDLGNALGPLSKVCLVHDGKSGHPYTSDLLDGKTHQLCY